MNMICLLILWLRVRFNVILRGFNNCDFRVLIINNLELRIGMRFDVMLKVKVERIWY